MDVNSQYTLRLSNMEVDGMVPWKTTFLYEQGLTSCELHFHDFFRYIQ